ncbi:MAG: hypothetical protein M1837_006265 [Sclerophora amabilis]|nr:MAG: hypothetical protein M1837_006265 [Sclerophora amabilis]
MKTRKIVGDSDEESDNERDATPESSSSLKSRSSSRDSTAPTRSSPSVDDRIQEKPDADSIEDHLGRELHDAHDALPESRADRLTAENPAPRESSASGLKEVPPEPRSRKRGSSEIIFSPRKRTKPDVSERPASSAPADEWELPRSSPPQNHVRARDDREKVATGKARSRDIVKEWTSLDSGLGQRKSLGRSKGVGSDEEDSDWDPSREFIEAEFVKRRTSRRNGEEGLLDGLERPRRGRPSSKQAPIQSTKEVPPKKSGSKASCDRENFDSRAAPPESYDDDHGENAIDRIVHLEQRTKPDASLEGLPSTAESDTAGREEDANFLRPIVEVQIVQPRKRKRPKRSKKKKSDVVGESDINLREDAALSAPPQSAISNSSRSEGRKCDLDNGSTDVKPSIEQPNLFGNEDHKDRPTTTPSRVLAEVVNQSSAPKNDYDHESNPPELITPDQPASEEVAKEACSVSLPPPQTPDKQVGEMARKKKDQHSPINSDKVPHRVGLSKKVKIQPLLRIVKK